MSEYREKWPEMRMKHLELIQGAVTRMGTSSANLKNYCMAMVAAIVGLAAAVSKEQILLHSLPVVGAFSVLDGTYLALERRFRVRYDEVRLKPLDCAPDFLMTPGSGPSFAGSFFSWSVLGFYGAIAGVLIALRFLMLESRV